MPTQNNLNESGLQCSAYISAINEAEAKQAQLKAYIAYDTLEQPIHRLDSLHFQLYSRIT